MAAFYDSKQDIVYIHPSPSADSRTATHPVCKAELLTSSTMHIRDVQMAMRFIIHHLRVAARNHDWTKVAYINEFYEDFTSGSTGKDFKEKHWYHDLHLKERHHLPDRCPDDVTLIDVIERVCDITMAGMARSGEVYSDELDPEILQRAYKNTIKLLTAHTKVVPNDVTPIYPSDDTESDSEEE